jgi:hypothetical protein
MAAQKANYETQCVIRVGWGRGGGGDIRGILLVLRRDSDKVVAPA